jgi:hypothetical protein
MQVEGAMPTRGKHFVGYARVLPQLPEVLQVDLVEIHH